MLPHWIHYYRFYICCHIDLTLYRIIQDHLRILKIVGCNNINYLNKQFVEWTLKIQENC